jgi:hypothetical protein
MKFKEGKPDGDMPFRYVYENIEVGIYPVLFGFRVRAGYRGSATYYIDWCCGDNQHTVRTYFQLLLEILEYRIEKGWKINEIFSELPPCSEIKPVFNDLKFLEYVLSYGRKELPLIHIPSLESLKELQMQSL